MPFAGGAGFRRMNEAAYVKDPPALDSAKTSPWKGTCAIFVIATD